MGKRQIANILGHVEYKQGKYRRVANIQAMIAVEPSITVTYDRAAAAQRAIDLSRANFRAFLDGGFPENKADVAAVVGKVDRNSPHDYSAYLTHRPLGTGSAIFISECIFAGGMPMTVRPNTNPKNFDCDSTDLEFYQGGFDDNGWRICPNQQSATNTWKNHEGIKVYFAADTVGLGGQRLDPQLIRDDIVNVVHQGPDANAGQLTEDETAHNNLINKINDPTKNLNTLKAGDYIFIDVSGGDSHGFMVVGWGPLLGTQDGIEYARTTPLSIERASLDSSHVIPYIADFCFGTKDAPTDQYDSENEDDRTGWLQDPRPRPFYSTQVFIIGDTNLRQDQVNYLRKIRYPNPTDLVIAHQRFAHLQWDFYKIPDTVTIPYGRIFYP